MLGGGDLCEIQLWLVEFLRIATTSRPATQNLPYDDGGVRINLGVWEGSDRS